MNQAHFATARRNMVDSQILPNRVVDENIIDAMSELPRENFLPSARRSMAYMDDSILIEDGRYIMQPMVLGRLLDIAETKSTDVALAIGCGTGYGVAVLARLVETVVAIESDASMRSKAERNLVDLGIDNVAIVDGEMAAGHAKEAPFDLIYIDGAVPEVPQAIIEQLADGGRLVAVEMPVGKPVGRGVIVQRFGASHAKREVFDAVEHMLPGFTQVSAFSF